MIPNYSHYYNYRRSVRGGGVSIFVHNNINHSHVEDICLDGNHFLWVHLKKHCLDIGVVYRKPDTNIKQFLEEYSRQIHKRKRAIIVGDFNFNILSNDSGTLMYKEILRENGYQSIHNK